MKLRTIFIAGFLTIFSACKAKKIEADKCQNGFMDAGETNIDCGGVCKTCTEKETSYLFLNLNGKEISFLPKTIYSSNNNYFLVAENDTINININLGSTLSVGTYSMPTTNTNGQMNLIAYPNASNGTYAFNKVDTTKRKLSGFFGVKLSRQNPDDTLYITGGQFSNISY